MHDLDEAIRRATAVVTATPENDPDRATSLNNLREKLSEMYSEAGDMEILEESILTARRVIDASTEDHPSRANYLNSLAVELHTRYSRTGEISDLEEAIAFSKQAVNGSSEKSLNQIHRMNNLAAFLRLRAAVRGLPEDLEEAVQLSRAGLAALSTDSSLFAEQLHNLATLLHNQYLVTDDVDTIEECIQLFRRAIELTPQSHTDFASYMECLGDSLVARYNKVGDMSGIESDILVAREALTAAPETSLQSVRLSSHLGQFLILKYLEFGNVSCLEEAISLGRSTVKNTPQNDALRHRYMNNLGIWLSYRHSLLGTMTDLEESIQITRVLIQETPAGFPAYAGLLNNLGNRLGEKFSRTNSITDLEEALAVTRDGVEATPHNHPSYPAWLNNLGNRYLDIYLKTRSRESLDDAIQIARTVIKAIPASHSSYILWLSNLGNRLEWKYSETGTLSFLEESIQIGKEILGNTSEDHADRAERLNRLGLRLGRRYQRNKSRADLVDSVSAHQSALGHSSSPIINRIGACRELIKYIGEIRLDDIYTSSQLMIDLIPRLAPRSLELKDKQYMLSQVFGLTSEAAAVALEVEDDPAGALEMLEMGRGVMATFFDEMRVDVLELEQNHPKLAKQFISIRNKLENINLPNDVEIGQQSAEDRGDQRRRADGEMDALLTEIRGRPGFESFLGAPKEEDIREAARDGPIIVINTTRYRCDAILVERHQIRSLPLPNLDEGEIDARAQLGNLGSLITLGWLWDVIAYPILNALGFRQMPVNGEWPRVWWICTGSLSMFPLHAAGYHLDGSFDTVCDRVMSSYSPSIKAVIRSRESVRKVPNSPRALLVAAGNSPGYAKLPFAAAEVQVVHGLCSSMNLVPISVPELKQELLSQLSQCDVFHFAGHGHTNGEDPSKSYLVLENGRRDPLTVANLFEVNLRAHSPFLAYLSACGTAQTREKKFIDESIHLTSTFQLAGFRHVIGTLWEVRDNICVDVARMVYEEISKQGMTDVSVCRGLHQATKELRDQWLHVQTNATMEAHRAIRMKSTQSRSQVISNEENGLTRDIEEDDSENIQLQWVPYIHFGA